MCDVIAQTPHFALLRRSGRRWSRGANDKGARAGSGRKARASIRASSWPGCSSSALIPLLVTPVLPLIDFYNHLARFFVLAHLGSSSALQAHYAGALVVAAGYRDRSHR